MRAKSYWTGLYSRIVVGRFCGASDLDGVRWCDFGILGSDQDHLIIIFRYCDMYR